MKKLATILLAMLLLMSMALAVQTDRFSIRGTGGEITKIDHTLVDTTKPSSASLSLYGSIREESQNTVVDGAGSVILVGKDQYNNRLQQRVKLSEFEVLQNNNNVLKVKAKGYYYLRSRFSPQEVSGVVTITVNKNTNTANVQSQQLGFTVQQMPVSIY